MSHAKSTKTQQIATLLRDGMTVARAGRKAEARHLFEAVLRLDPGNEEAILWWAGLARDPRVALAALTRVLEINPHHQRARAGVRAVRCRLAVWPVSPDSAGTQHKKQWPANPSPVVSDRCLNALFVGLTLLVMVLSCILVAGALPEASQAVWAAFSPTATPVVSPSASLRINSTEGLRTSTVEPPTVVATVTATASPTVTPTPTLTPTHTPAPTLAFAVPPISSAPTEDKWIDLDLSDQRLVAYVGTVPVYAVRVSTGVPRFPTVKGQFRIYRKLTATLMSGPGYYLPNVPWTMYYYKSYAIHGTYWHNNFGRPMSHGCVNLSTPDAKWLFDWTPEETLVVIHD